jgi:uncharacterized membrane protein|tara:strand:+ start:98 stop:532 length:435 start_codon:yes stop_codon:yes gene_type:complete
MNPIKLTKFFLLLVFAVMISTFLTYLFYNSYVIENIITLDMLVKVDDHFGLNADADAIKFGMIMPGTSGERSIMVNNSAAYPLKAIILKSGYIADWVKVSENNFILKENENRQIIFEVSAPENADYGNYTGEVKIIFKKTLFGK